MQHKMICFNLIQFVLVNRGRRGGAEAGERHHLCLPLCEHHRTALTQRPFLLCIILLASSFI